MSFASLLIQTCQVRKRNPSDEWGEGTFTDQPAVSCRFSPVEKSIGIDGEGKNILIDGFFYLKAADKPNQSDQLKFEGDNYRILEVKKHLDSTVEHHVRVMVRKDG